MASVWAARLRGKHAFEKLVAIKTILPRLAGDARFREMFTDEARIAARIDHPNVAQVFDLGEDGGVLYLAMEYVDGDSLSKLNRACQRQETMIPPGVVLRVLADACAGLHEAHELKGEGGKPLGIVHRDISPHNLLCTARGVVKLIDFGIAKTDSPAADSAELGVLKGKIQYMAPEQALGRTVDRRADLWAIGAILYHVLAGRAPYEGASHVAVLHLLGSGVPPRPLPPEVHPAVAAVARKALALDPAKRYATAADLRDAIERAMVFAQLTTTSGDVAAFAARLLADRVKRRHDAVDRALEAAAERGRAAGPPMEVAPVTTADTSGATTPSARSPVDVGAVSDARPSGAKSYASLGPAALAASATTASTSRAHWFAAVALGVGLATAIAASIGPYWARQPRHAHAATSSVVAAPLSERDLPVPQSDMESAIIAPVASPMPLPQDVGAAPPVASSSAHPGHLSPEKRPKKPARPDANPY